MASNPLIPRAIALAEVGQGADAVRLLEQAGRDPAALLMLGLWRIEGEAMPRDLVAARSLLGEAATLGHPRAQRIFAGMVATGTGGPADWPGALRLVAEGAASDPEMAREQAVLAAMDLDEAGDPRTLPPPQPLSADPRIWTVPGLFSAAECRFLIERATPRLRRATVFDTSGRRFVEHRGRTADAAGFPVVNEEPAVHALNRRLAAASGTDVRQGEPLNVLRYGVGQEYRAHVDAVPGLANQRVLTALVYLNDGYEGGATRFPAPDLTVRGKPGDALFFVNVLPDGRADVRTVHMGQPVIAGEKLLASRWIRAEPPPPGEAFGPEEVTG